MAIFHYALNPGAILFLGASESIGTSVDLFKIIDSKWKVFKTAGKSIYRPNLQLSTRHSAAAVKKEGMADVKEAGQPSFDELTGKMLLDLYAPACVIIKDDGAILYFYGRTGKFLEPAQGKAKLDIYDMARQGLKNAVLEGIKKVRLGQG